MAKREVGAIPIFVHFMWLARHILCSNGDNSAGVVGLLVTWLRISAAAGTVPLFECDVQLCHVHPGGPQHRSQANEESVGARTAQ